MTRTLFLAWKNSGTGHDWFPVGRLDADLLRHAYRFRYIGGARRAQTEAGFPLLMEFPHLERDYWAPELFPLFRNRIINPRRPDLEDPDGSFSCRFFLHGWRHVNSDAQTRLQTLVPKEELYVTLELTNPETGLAVQIQTTDYHMIGWAPRYLVRDLTEAMIERPRDYAANVVRINPQPAPSKQRVLIEMRGTWDDYEPMIGPDYQPVVPD